MVDVVQLVEHRIVVPSVVGSSPIIHPPQKQPLSGCFFVVWMIKFSRYPLPKPLSSGEGLRRRSGGAGL